MQIASTLPDFHQNKASTVPHVGSANHSAKASIFIEPRELLKKDDRS
jgi:hypothetical protein